MAVIKLIFHRFGPLCYVYQDNCVIQNLESLLFCWWEAVPTVRTDAASKEELQLLTFSTDNCIENMPSNFLPTMKFSLI